LLLTEWRGLLVCHTNEPCKNGRTDRDAVWVEHSGGPRYRVLDGVQIPMGQFWGKGLPVAKYLGLSAMSCAETAELIDLLLWEATLAPPGEYD